ncbi:MAG: ribosome silencing factor [Chloroflexota bacterium]
MAKYGKPRTAKGLATLCAKVAGDKLASDVQVLDLTKIDSRPADFFVLCTCDSDVQVKAIYDEVLRTCTDLSINKPREEGIDNREWALLDFFDVVMHIMVRHAREYYKIEKLWGDAKFYSLSEEGELKSSRDQKIKEILDNNIANNGEAAENE